MKILFVEYTLGGHHHIYLRNLTGSGLYSSAVCVRQKDETYDCPVYCSEYDPEQSRASYHAWLKDVKQAAEREQADIIQFMAWDGLMKYFGSGLSQFRQYRLVIIYHHFWPGFTRRLAYRYIDRYISAVIVHTEENRKAIADCGVRNVIHIEYPAFGERHDSKTVHYPKKLLAFGATRYDKGLDILLEALKGVRVPFVLEIAGPSGTYDSQYIQQQTAAYADRVVTDLRFVSEEEKDRYFADTDIVVLPYRKEFDGASGPLAEGVNQGKMIIGPDHGSLGKIIAGHHLGLTFESGDVTALREVLRTALKKDFVYDDTAEAYRESLKPEDMRMKYEAVYEAVCQDGD